jgi:hypothetical protein
VEHIAEQLRGKEINCKIALLGAEKNVRNMINNTWSTIHANTAYRGLQFTRNDDGKEIHLLFPSLAIFSFKVAICSPRAFCLSFFSLAFRRSCMILFHMSVSSLAARPLSLLVGGPLGRLRDIFATSTNAVWTWTLRPGGVPTP